MAGKNLTRVESRMVMTEIIEERASKVQISAYLVALRMKGETVDEIAGAAEAVTEKSQYLTVENPGIVDICGTGGDNLSTFNISTTAAFVTAGAGVKVAKHGHKSASGKCGSSDLLTALGVQIDSPRQVVEECFRKIGIAFLFAEKFNKSQPYLLGPRMEIGAWTIFNLIGPMTNPARTKRQVVGVNDKSIMHTVVEVMQELGAEHIMAVHGSEGLDEISICGHTSVVELYKGIISEYEIHPVDFGLQTAPLSQIQTESCADNMKILREVLAGKKGAPRDVVLLNSAAAIRIAGAAGNLQEGLKMATKSIDSGAAQAKLDGLIELTMSAN